MANIQVGFFEHITMNFGQETTTKFKHYALNNTRLSNMTTRKNFLIQCRRKGVFPAHIVNTLKCTHPLLEDRSPYMGKLQRIMDKFKKALLNIEIKHTFYKIKCLKRDLENGKLDIVTSASPDIALGFITTQNRSFENNFNKTQRKTNDKLNKLMEKLVPDETVPTLNERSILNATTLTVPPQTTLLLSLGPKFSHPVTRLEHIPMFHLIADVESILRTSDDQAAQDKNRCLAATQIQNHISRIKSNRYKDSLQAFCDSATRETKRFLAEHPEVCVLESDKGKRMVLMKVTEYDEKMNALLTDSTYKVLPKDPTPSVERKNNNLVDRLLDLHLIDKDTGKRLRNKTSICPRIYGQPKAHKANLPLRPVVPNITAPTYQLSKYLSSILKQAHQSIFNIKDSFTFVEQIRNVTLPPDYCLVSFDVVSLFTNVPKLLVIHDIIACWDVIQRATDIDLSLFLELVEFLLDNSYFCFRGKFYMQTFGTAMGSPISPILADLVMEILLLNVLRQLEFEVPVLYKYVDDLLIALPNNKTHDTLALFNSYNEHLQFTMEEERDSKIPFLDTVVIRNQDQTVSTEWFSKPIASGRLLNYLSFHPTGMKINVAANFIHRVTSLTTDQPLQQQKQIIFKHLRLNNYPTTLINRLWSRNNMNNTTGNHPTTTSETAQTTYRSLPHIPILTSALISSFKNDFPNTKVARKTLKTNSQILKNIRDPVQPLQKSKVVYSIPCNNCQMTYIGMTKNKLQTRMYGHKHDVNKLQSVVVSGITNIEEQKDKLKDRTALIEHCIEEGHSFGLDKVQIIDSTFKSTALPILEMCHIAVKTNTVNHRTDVEKLGTTYTGILHSINTHITRRNNISTNTSLEELTKNQK
ncbi:uncharacterized protein LOC120413525 [Culex pipiens pallens]|uniref:uncharacterized protein LOC120413525 n=1 Tax=Culex pipiens pallens TaxID=42434 RepID=UPI0019540723|nr:uncharacterized protein LOC120413525 [Culex pipiens pallens]